MVKLAVGGFPCCSKSTLEASRGLQATLKKSDIMVILAAHNVLNMSERYCANRAVHGRLLGFGLSGI